jgi:hypothetical protein
MLIDTILWVVLIGMIAVVPCGCIMTRSASKSAPPATH